MLPYSQCGGLLAAHRPCWPYVASERARSAGEVGAGGCRHCRPPPPRLAVAAQHVASSSACASESERCRPTPAKLMRAGQ